MSKIFISYSFKEPDSKLAKDIYSKLLKEEHDCFLAQEDIYLGDDWALVIEEKINSFDYFIPILSVNSRISDMVIEEIRRAKKYYDSKPPDSKPGILPIRMSLPMSESINYDIDAYLSRFQQRVWYGESDSEVIIKEVIFVITRRSSTEVSEEEKNKLPKVNYDLSIPTPVAPLEEPGGVVALNNPFYIIRKGEKDFIQSVTNENVLLKIFAPRQYGKTSILSRIIEAATNKSFYVASFSFQLLEINQLQNLDDLVTQICISCAESASRPYDEYASKYDEIWKNKFEKSSKRKCDKFFEQYLLKVIDKPIVLAIDEADRIFPFKDVSSEFFSLLRLWSEQTKIKGKEIFKKLKIVVSYSTEASLAIPDQTQSPFNTGQHFDAFEFSEEEVKRLISLHALTLSEEQIVRLTELIGGHPYLIRKFLYCLVNSDSKFEDLIDRSFTDGGPFNDHLKRQYWSVSRKEGYLKTLKDIITTGISHDKEICDKLFSAGLIKGDTPKVKIKNKLYEQYFRNKLL
jgi:serine/threonine-protein kinase